MNQIDIDYQNLVRDILENGNPKNDRTGTGTISVFGRTIRHSMKDGFPLLTTKKMAWKTMVTELLWFLRGDTNIKYLVDNDCHIWDGDAYKNYLKKGQQEADTDKENKTFLPLPKEWFINKIKTDDEFAKKWGELGPLYGKQWRSWHTRWDVVEDKSREAGVRRIEYGIDQIANVIHLLKTDPDSRRMIVNAWNVGELDQMVLPPCHIMFQFYTRELSAKERTAIGSKGSTRLYDMIKEGNYETLDADIEMHKVCDDANVPKRAISLRWNQRSVDVGLGLPFNIASYALLLEIIAKEVNMVPEELIGDLGDCHIYNNHIDGLKEQLTRVPYELPKLKIEDEVVWTEYECLPSYSIKDFSLENYQSHSSIKLQLSN